MVRCLALLPLAALGCTPPPAARPSDPGPPKVTVARPLVRTVTAYTDLTGTLAAVKSADIRPRVSGYVQQVLFEEGAEVAAGQPLVKLDPKPFEAALAQARANVATSEAQRQLAESTAARLRAGGRAISGEELEQAQAQVGSTRATVEANRAAAEQAELNLGYATVTAPFAGRIDRIFVNEGNVVTGGTGQGTILTRLVTVDPVYAYFTVDEQTVLDYLRRAAREGRTGKGQGLPVEVRLRDETGYPHRGTLDFAGSELNPATGSLQVRGTFANPGPPRLLRPGLFVRGRIPVAAPAERTLIPDEAIVTDQAERVVYVVGPGNRVVARRVALGPQFEGLRVADGLKPDDQVIIRGLARLQPDTEVDPQPGEIRPTPPNTAAGPTGWGNPGGSRSGGDPGAGAAPGAGGNATPASGGRGSPPTAAGTPKGGQ